MKKLKNHLFFISFKGNKDAEKGIRWNQVGLNLGKTWKKR